MILQPIQQQRVLPTQITQQYLPAITVDTAPIHKLINQLYNKTVVLPPTQTVEVSNYVETPQGLIRTDSSAQTLTPQPSLIQSVMPQTQLVNVQPTVNPVLVPQSVTSLQPVSVVQQTIPIVQKSVPLVQQRVPIVQQSIPIARQSMMVQPFSMQQIIGQPLINQSALLRPLSVSYNYSTVMRPYL